MAKTELEISTGEGSARAGLFAPRQPGRSRAGVIFYMDAFGPRPALDEMAERMAGRGLLGAGARPVLPVRRLRSLRCQDRLSSTEPSGAGSGHDRQAPRRSMTERDSEAFLDALAGAGAAARSARWAIAWAAGARSPLPQPIPTASRAAASFHGGNLASDAPDSPHQNAAKIKAGVYVGSAGVDRSFPPEQSARLAEAPAPRRGRSHHRELCRDGSWLGGVRPWRL